MNRSNKRLGRKFGVREFAPKCSAAKSNAEHGRDATPAEVQVSRKQLRALHKDGLLIKTKTGNSDLFSYRGG